MLHGTGKAQLQIQQRGQGPGPLADLTDQFHNVPVLQRQRKAAAQPGGGGEGIDQPQQLVVALIQHGGPGVEPGILFPGALRSQLGCRQVEIAQCTPHLSGNGREEGGQIGLLRLHETLLSGAEGVLNSMCGRSRVQSRKTLPFSPTA